MSKHKPKSSKTNYIEELKEWQEHQYDPGYYRGGRIHPFHKIPGNPRLYGIFMTFIGLMFLVVLIAAVSNAISNKDALRPQGIFYIVLNAGLVVVLFAAGIRRLKGSAGKNR